MGLRDCLTSAVDQGAISRQEAAALGDEFEERFAQNRASLGDDTAAAQARLDLENALRKTAIEKRRRANLTEAARLRLKGQLLDYRNAKGEADVFEAAMGVLSHYGYRGASSVRGRTEAITALAHGKLADLMGDVRRAGILGKMKNRPLLRDIVKELKGEASGNALAAGHARAIATVMEDLRQRFNNAGGAIPRLDGWGLPQSHDRAKIKALGRDGWKQRIAPLLDAERMTNPLTGDPVGAAGLDRALDHVYDTIVSEGWANKLPTMVPAGRGALATQRADPRFLVFKSSDAWFDYNSAFGRGDPLQSIFMHINGMAKDIAAMEVLGPNPQGMVEYMKQAVSHEIGKRQAGKPSRAAKGLLDESAVRGAQYRIDGLYGYLRGRPEVVSGWARATADIKNVLSAGLLGSASILAGVSDPFIAQSARRLAGLPIMKDVGQMVKTLAKMDKRDLARTGIIWEEYVHLLNDEARIAGIVTGSDWSRWVVDRSVTVSGLKPLTTARKFVEARMWQHHLADQAAQGFDRLDPKLRATMQGFGINAGDWEIMRRGIDESGFLTPRQIELNGGEVRYLDRRSATPAEIAAEESALAHRAVAEKFAELVTSWGERSVPAGTPNARSLISGAVPRGTLPGELVDFGLQFKSFGLSFTSLQLEALGHAAAFAGDGRAARIAGGAKYLALLVIPLTIAGAVHMQIKQVLDGKDPEDMSPQNTAFWLRAMVTGGGFGLFGDFLAASENRFGQGLTGTLAGPGPAALGDLGGLTVGNAMELARGEDTHAGRELTKFLGRYTPVLASHWATRGAYRRMILDQLQWLLDADAHKSFRAQEVNAKSRTGQEYFWRPGEFTPDRPPDLAAATGN